MVWIYLIYLFIYCGDKGPDWLGPDLLGLRLASPPGPPDLEKKRKKKEDFFPSFDLVCLKIKWLILILAFNWQLNLDLRRKIGYQINVGHWTKSFFSSSFKVELIWIWASWNIFKIMTWHMSTFHGFGVTNFTIAK